MIAPIVFSRTARNSGVKHAHKRQSEEKSMNIPTFNFKGADRVPTHQNLLNLLESIRGKKNVFVDTTGRSREGRNLLFCSIGSGSKVIGVTSGAHSDEPVGIATTYNFIQELTTSSHFDELLEQFTFAIFPMLDPDGSALNESWTNDLTYRSYFLNNYRNNQPSEDCEHGIPISETQEIRPEMAFFKKNIDRYKSRIEYYVTLHTTHVLGGSLFVVDRDFQNQKIISGLSRLCTDYQLPLWDYQPNGDATLTYIAPGFIGAPSVNSYAEEYKNAPQILAMIKMSTYEYVLRKCGGKFGLISELPMYLAGGDFVSLGETDVPLSDLKRRGLEADRSVHQQRIRDIEEINGFLPNEKNPWYKAALFMLKAAPEGMANEESNLSRYEGKRAQKCDVATFEQLTPIENELKRHRLFIKCLEGNPRASRLVQEHQKKFSSLFEKYESLFRLTPVPVQKQVEIQTGMILQGVQDSL